jgi:hypothetical protein
MKKITKSSLDELAKIMPVLSYEEEFHILGGGTGTREDPYTVEEYERMVASGTWHGGFVGDWGYTTAEVTVTGNQRTVTGYTGYHVGVLPSMGTEILPTYGAGSYDYRNYTTIENGQIVINANVLHGLGSNYKLYGMTSLYVDGVLVITGILKLPTSYYNQSGWVPIGSAGFDLTQYHGKVEIQLEIGSNFDHGAGTYEPAIPKYKETVYSAYRD